MNINLRKRIDKDNMFLSKIKMRRKSGWLNKKEVKMFKLSKSKLSINNYNNLPKS